MDRMTVDSVLLNLSIHLHLSKETEHEILDEIRAHLEDAVENARQRGADEQEALRAAAEQFGMLESGAALQEVHNHKDGISALTAAALPVLFAVLLRWLIFAPDGSPAAWRKLLDAPAFYIIAAAALVIPVLAFRRWRFALVTWAFFWLLTVIFALYPAATKW